MSTANFVKLGAQLMEQGAKLDQLKAEREALNVQIAALETEIAPIFIQYNAMLSEVMGKAIAPQQSSAASPSSAPPTAAPDGLRGGAMGVPATGALAQRIALYIRRAQASGQVEGRGLSAEQIGKALSIPAADVKEAMAEMRSNAGRRAAVMEGIND